ncbi:putative beta-lysine N-acetyltransferase [Peribacillus butanolivorans]|uniref:Beta-lysine N-acetyltransferase n=1 Tax=Peribacillus butanolivorans TaxID=421767 RepID=A0AAX0RS91_9BACI|nr:putative beta-lysine N-acetyltransferase [Peribacillus butanolivorans]KON70667.1 beta-lysine acetyltransferase [Peribacillus butanolivorans]PEJ34246.1 putative beta-lysine N-acetyltransferase [Peribacillus butanolivorans]
MTVQKLPFFSRIETGECFTMELYLDHANHRLRIDDYRGNIKKAITRALVIAQEHGFTKVILKARQEDLSATWVHGFMLEGILSKYFNGNDAYCMALYLTNERRTSDYWMKEDKILQDVIDIPRIIEKQQLPENYTLRFAEIEDALELANLYGAIFETYPTPMNDEGYIKKVMEEGTIFSVIEYEGSIVSAASAEVNEMYHNAELTDCATIPHHRKHGFMKVLISALEQELIKKNIYCSYSLARSLSMGMNAVFHQLGYEYGGRFTKNCNIWDKYEDMNIWGKDLSSVNGFFK